MQLHVGVFDGAGTFITFVVCRAKSGVAIPWFIPTLGSACKTSLDKRTMCQ